VLGGDGYLGWSLALALGNRTDYNIVLVDNLIKRQWEEEVTAKTLVPLPAIEERIDAYRRLIGKDNLSFRRACLLDKEALCEIFREVKPCAVINAAQQPSAPFSMMSAKNAAATFSNNIIGNVNVLYAIGEVDKTIKYIKLGSAGCYMDIDTDCVPLEKVDMSFMYEGQERKILNSWIPMHAGDFYHQSRISDFIMNDLAARIWNLKIITVQQATIFGATVEENRDESRHELSTRFNYDAVFGTVLNRFVCQIAIGHPLTIYGNGEQCTGIISLSETVENFLNLVEAPITPGEHVVVHNFSHRLSIKEIATKLAQVGGGAKVYYLKNPRKEAPGELSKVVSVHPLIARHEDDKEERLRTELSHFINFTKRYAHNIDASIIIPKVEWSKVIDTHEKREKKDILQLRNSGTNQEARV
jgi:UDP-sulfoquinovose synthase